MNTAEILYDFKNAKSLKIYPRKVRKDFKDINFKSEERARKALNASEKEVKHLMDVANRRLEKIASIVDENLSNGHHLTEELFIPEYLGFTEVLPEGIDAVRIYSRDGYNITRVEGGGWLVLGPKKIRAILSLPNMYLAITILQGIGLDVNVSDYMNGKYRSEKPLGEIVEEVVIKIIEARNDKG